MREAEGWSQKKLAEKAFGDSKLQSMVSRLEDPDYGKYSVSTLLTLADAFDVGLVVRFAPFSELVDWDINKSGPTLDPPPFAKDEALRTEAKDISIEAAQPAVAAVETRQPNNYFFFYVDTSTAMPQNADTYFRPLQLRTRRSHPLRGAQHG